VTEKIAILILGMHRSGTSAIARTLSLLGAGLPADLVDPNEGNPLGHWEPRGIVELNDRMLSDAGSDVYSAVDISPNWFDSEKAAAFVIEAASVVETSFQNQPLIVVKDPRVAVLLPIWRKAFEKLAYRCVDVLPLRDPGLVAASLRRRHLQTIAYDAWPSPRGEAVWLRYTLAALKGTRSTPRFFLRYTDLLSDWRLATAELARDSGIVWPNGDLEATGREIDSFLHANKEQNSPTAPFSGVGDVLPIAALAVILYRLLDDERSDDVLVDQIAQDFSERMNGARDLIASYEGLYPLIWRYYSQVIAKSNEHELSAVRARLDQKTEEVNRLLSSTSWRLTAPLRSLVHLLKASR
jgi:hypothetical protein